MPERDATSIVQLKVRMREPLRARLEQAAQGTGHSMNAEVLERLERSFERQDLADEILTATYGRQLTGLLMAVGRTMKDAGTFAGFRATGTLEGSTNWLENPDAFDQGAKAATTIIEAFRPVGEISEPVIKSTDEKWNAILENLGEGFATTTLTIIAAPEQQSKPELRDWGRKVHDMLAPLTEVIS